MSVFKRTLPQPPQPTDKPDVQREADHIRALDEARSVLDAFIKVIQQFEPTQVTTADGKVVRALLQVLGNAPEDVSVDGTPFQFLQGAYNGDGVFQPAGGTNSFLLNADSYLRADATLTANTGMTNSTTALAFADGDQVLLQLDTSDGETLNEASIVKNPPDFDSTHFCTFTGSGTQADPYLWNQSFALLAQVFAADSSGQPQRGGIVYTVDKQTPPTQIEVVQMTWTHLSLRPVLASGRFCLLAFPDCAPLLS